MTKPLDFRWHHAINESGLAAREKNVLRTMLTWLNRHTGEGWPSVPTIARAASLCVRTIEDSLKVLEREGVLTYLERSRGGRHKTHRVQLSLEALESRNPERAAGFTDESNPATGGTKPRSPCAETPQSVSTNPAAVAGEPSIQPPNEPSKGPTMPERSNSERSGGWMDGPTEAMNVRDALKRCGIRGTNLERLADAPDLTVAELIDEWRAILSDKSTRNPVGLLAHRLSERTGIILPRNSQAARRRDLHRIAAQSKNGTGRK